MKLLLKAKQIDLVPKSDKSAYEKGSMGCAKLREFNSRAVRTELILIGFDCPNGALLTHSVHQFFKSKLLFMGLSIRSYTLREMSFFCKNDYV